MINNPEQYNWSDSFKICEILLNNPLETSEATSRLIVNRCYYAAYGQTSNYLKNNGIYERKKLDGTNSGHRDLINKLDDITNPLYSDIYIKDPTKRKRYSRIKKTLKKLINLRVEADYQPLCIIGHFKDAKKAVFLTKYLLMLITFLDTNSKFNPVLEAEPTDEFLNSH